MAKTPKPWFRKGRGWFVTIGGKQHNLGRNKKATFHSLYAFRHSFATHALERGIDSVTVAVLMGHSDPSMLAKVYQHLTQNPRFLLDQAKKIRA